MKTRKNERNMKTRGYKNIVFTQNATRKEDVGSQGNNAITNKTWSSTNK
jgi:hypothetical protein